VLEMSALRMKACWKSFTPLINSSVDNVLVKIASDLYQPLFQFINALDVCMINTLLHGRPYLTVNLAEVWAV